MMLDGYGSVENLGWCSKEKNMIEIVYKNK